MIDKIEDKLLDFYNHSKSVIISERLLEITTDLLEKEELRYFPTHQCDGDYLVAFLKDNNVKLEEQESIISKEKFYYVFIEESFDLQNLPFSYTYIPLIVKEASVEIMY